MTLYIRGKVVVHVERKKTRPVVTGLYTLKRGSSLAERRQGGVVTETHAAVLQQVAQVIKHGLLVLTADPAEIAQEAAAVGHHLRKSDFLKPEEPRNGNISTKLSVSIAVP